MKKKIFSLVLAISVLATTSIASAATVYVDASATGAGNGTTQIDAFTTIQAAIDAVTTVNGDIISIADGTYTITTTIEVSKELTLQGTTQAGTIINASNATGPFGRFGIHSSKSNITFNDFTLTSPTGTQGRGFKIEGTTANTSGAAQDGVRSTNVNINRVTVNGDGGTASRTGIDLNGINGVSLVDVTSNNNGGNGVSFTDCNNVVMTNVTTSGNKFGGVALYTLGQYYPGGISGVTVTNLNASENNPFYNQNEGTFNSGNPFPTASVSAPQYAYKGTTTLANGYVFYNEDLNELYTTMGSNASASTIVEVSSGNTIVAPGQTIQSRIDAATPGDVIFVPAGNYTENITINKAITLKGPNESINAVTGTRVSEAVITGKILITASDITLKGFSITNPSYSSLGTIHGIQIFGGGPTISNINVSNNIVSNINNLSVPVKGAYGIMVQADVSNVMVQNNKIDTITSAGWARGIEVTPSCGVVGVPQTVSITGNSIKNIIDTNGTDSYNFSVDWCDSVPRIANAGAVTLTGNTFDTTKIRNLDNLRPLLISRNWFESIYPDFSSATGSITSYPWCIDSGCVSLYSPAGASGGGSNTTTSGSTISTTTANTTATTSTSTTTPTTTTTPTLTENASSAGQVLGAEKFNFTKNLGYGSRGNDVSELQKILLAQKFLVLKTGLPTGWFGPMTRAALIKWQIANGVPATGIFGTLSREKMNK